MTEPNRGTPGNGLSHSAELFDRARRVLVGGVNSPVRAFGAVGGTPRFVDRATAAFIFDSDGHRYVDLVCSWGAAIVGHAHPAVVEAVKRAAAGGLSFGACCEAEAALAEIMVSAIPSIERVRFVNSGTEAAMSALRLARGATGRTKIIKFAGCYHGHVDSLLVSAGSGAATFGVPNSAGVPPAFAATTLVAPYNDVGTVERLMGEHGRDVAAIIVEPIAGNMGYVEPVSGQARKNAARVGHAERSEASPGRPRSVKPEILRSAQNDNGEPGGRVGFLEGLRALCDRHGALLIFDEVMTGFRVAWGGYQNVCGVRPDLTCLGKVIGGGMPVAAYGGPRRLMEQVSPMGPVYQAGTLSGNPVGMAAGRATLELCREPGFYDRLSAAGARLVAGLQSAAGEHGIPLQTGAMGGMLGMFFTDQPVCNFDDARRCDHARYAKFFQAMLSLGIWLPPSGYEAMFISAAHRDEVVDWVVSASRTVFRSLLE